MLNSTDTSTATGTITGTATGTPNLDALLDETELAPKGFEQLLEEHARQQLKQCGEQLDALPMRYELGHITRDAYEKFDRYLTLQAEVWRGQLSALGFDQPVIR